MSQAPGLLESSFTSRDHKKVTEKFQINKLKLGLKFPRKPQYCFKFKMTHFLHHVTITSSMLGSKIITSLFRFKITALTAILFQIQNGGGDRLSAAFVYIR